jgi:hypothetical protein
MAILLFTCLLASIVILVRVAVFLLNGQSVRTAGILRRWSLGVAAYLAIVIAVTALPGKSDGYARGPHCDDDWCMSVDKITNTPGAPGEVVYRLAVRVFSLAHRGLRSANGAWLYVNRRARAPLQSGPRSFGNPHRCFPAPRRDRCHHAYI